jgi:ABC-2 type transport system permease protein
MKFIRQTAASFKKYNWLMHQLVQRDLKLKYKRSILGYLWSLLQPLLMMAVMSIIFSQIFRYNVDNYPVYLISSNGMSSIIGNAGLIKKVYIPKYVFPVTKCLVSLVNFLWSLVAVVIIVLIYSIHIGFPILMAWFPVLFTFIFSLGVSLMVATAATFFRDVLYLYGILLQIWMYFTPLFYPVEALPKAVADFIWWNPLYHYITYFRDIVMYNTLPSLQEHLVCIAWAIGALIIGTLIFNKHQRKFLMYI